MTTRKELLSISGAINTMTYIIDAMNKAKNVVTDNQYKLDRLLEYLDKNGGEIEKIKITLWLGVEAPIDINLQSGDDDLNIDKITALVADVLAKRTADAMDEVRKLAARMGV